MRSFKGDKVFYIDCDDSLVLWNLSKYPSLPRITVKTPKGSCKLIPHEKNIKLVQKFALLGYKIVVWSGSGWKWAETICKAIGIRGIVDLCISKPDYYLDDQDSSVWMRTRIWRKPT